MTWTSKAAMVVAGMATAAVMAVTAPHEVRAQGSQAEGQAMSIEGTWLVQVQLRVCQTQAPLGAPFSSLVTFLSDGRVIESTEAPAFAAGQRPPAHGRWTRRGASRYSQRMLALIAFDTPPNPPASPGFQRGGTVFSQTVELVDPDTMTSSGINEFYTAAGVLYRSGCATATGRRFR
jgi:hypothetical protein